jgi:hypothetical protein
MNMWTVLSHKPQNQRQLASPHSFQHQQPHPRATHTPPVYSHSFRSKRAIMNILGQPTRHITQTLASFTPEASLRPKLSLPPMTRFTKRGGNVLRLERVTQVRVAASAKQIFNMRPHKE